MSLAPNCQSCLSSRGGLPIVDYDRRMASRFRCTVASLVNRLGLAFGGALRHSRSPLRYPRGDDRCARRPASGPERLRVDRRRCERHRLAAPDRPGPALRELRVPRHQLQPARRRPRRPGRASRSRATSSASPRSPARPRTTAGSASAMRSRRTACSSSSSSAARPRAACRRSSAPDTSTTTSSPGATTTRTPRSKR